MNKKGYTLIGFGLILYCINITSPFLGIGVGEVSVTFLPLSAIASYILIAIGVKSVNKNQNKFKAASILFYIVSALIAVVSMIIPLLTKNGFEELYEIYDVILNSNDVDQYASSIICISVNIFNGLNSYLILMFFVEIVACVGIFIMLSGFSTENIETKHKAKLNSTGKKSVIFNLITIFLSILIISLMTNFFEVGLKDPNNTGRFILNYLGIVFVMFCMMPFSILTLINKIKFIVFMFKTPANLIVENEEEINL